MFYRMYKLLIFSCTIYQVLEFNAFYTVNQVTKHLRASERASDQHLGWHLRDFDSPDSAHCDFYLHVQ